MTDIKAWFIGGPMDGETRTLSLLPSVVALTVIPDSGPPRRVSYTPSGEVAVTGEYVFRFDQQEATDD